MKNKGFTLIEIMTSLSIFMVVMTIAMGAILGIYDANRKARAESYVMGNLNLALETMSREIRFGKNYHCGSFGTISSPQNCASSDDYISFISSDGVQIEYKQSGSMIEKNVDNTGFLAMTAPEVIIEDLAFYVLGATVESVSNEQQPKVLIKIKGYSGITEKTKGYFTVQALVSQRKLDNGL